MCDFEKNKTRSLESTNHCNVSYGELKRLDELQEYNLLKYHSRDVQKIEYMFECQWKKMKLENAVTMRAFWISSPLSESRPVHRLIPRATLRGGFIELYR